MKLITETVEAVEYLTEATAEGKKNYFIEGVFLQSEIRNRNGRIYPKNILVREVTRYNKDYITENRAVGELGHPDTPTINYDRVSHKIISLKEHGNDFIGKAKILDTPMGKIVKTLMDEGVKIGVSSRGMGSLKPIREQSGSIVQDDFHLATPADIVADPSAPGALVSGIMENQEWVYDAVSGNFRLIEEIQEEVRSAKKKNLEEATLRGLEKFLKSL